MRGGPAGDDDDDDDANTRSTRVTCILRDNASMGSDRNDNAV